MLCFYRFASKHASPSSHRRPVSRRPSPMHPAPPNTAQWPHSHSPTSAIRPRWSHPPHRPLFLQQQRHLCCRLPRCLLLRPLRFPPSARRFVRRIAPLCTPRSSHCERWRVQCTAMAPMASMAAAAAHRSSTHSASWRRTRPACFSAYTCLIVFLYARVNSSRLKFVLSVLSSLSQSMQVQSNIRPRRHVARLRSLPPHIARAFDTARETCVGNATRGRQTCSPARECVFDRGNVHRRQQRSRFGFESQQWSNAYRCGGGAACVR